MTEIKKNCRPHFTFSSSDKNIDYGHGPNSIPKSTDDEKKNPNNEPTLLGAPYLSTGSGVEQVPEKRNLNSEPPPPSKL